MRRPTWHIDIKRIEKYELKEMTIILVSFLMRQCNVLPGGRKKNLTKIKSALIPFKRNINFKTGKYK